MHRLPLKPFRIKKKRSYLFSYFIETNIFGNYEIQLTPHNSLQMGTHCFANSWLTVTQQLRRASETHIMTDRWRLKTLRVNLTIRTNKRS